MTNDTAHEGAAADDLALLGRLTRGVLHELANPILALMGTAELALADAEAGTKLHSRLEVVHSTALEIGEIVRALQRFIREADEPARRFSLAELAEGAIVFVRRLSAVRDVELAAGVEGEPWVETAPGPVRRRLVELLLDGIAAAERGDVVTLLVLLDGDEAVAFVAGIGELRLVAAP